MSQKVFSTVSALLSFIAPNLASFAYFGGILTIKNATEITKNAIKYENTAMRDSLLFELIPRTRGISIIRLKEVKEF